jgi:hypothetical protein
MKTLEPLVKNERASASQQVIIGLLLIVVIIFGIILYKSGRSPAPSPVITPPSPPSQADLSAMEKNLTAAFTKAQEDNVKNFRMLIEQATATNIALFNQITNQSGAAAAERAGLSNEVVYLKEMISKMTNSPDQASNTLATTTSVKPPDGTPPGPPEPRTDTGGKNNLGPLADLAATGICIIKPPLCLAAQFFAAILKGFGSKEAIATFEKVFKGLSVSSPELRSLADQLIKAGGPELIKAREALQKVHDLTKRPEVAELLKMLSEKPLPAGVQKLIDEFKKNPPRTAEDFKRLVNQIFPDLKLDPAANEALRGFLEAYGKLSSQDMNPYIDVLKQL